MNKNAKTKTNAETLVRNGPEVFGPEEDPAAAAAAVRDRDERSGDTLLLHADVAASFTKQDVEAQLPICSELS